MSYICPSDCGIFRPWNNIQGLKKKRKEILSFVDLSNTMPSEVSQIQKDKFYLYEESEVVELIEAENGLVIVRGWEKGEMRRY